MQHEHSQSDTWNLVDDVIIVIIYAKKRLDVQVFPLVWNLLIQVCGRQLMSKIGEKVVHHLVTN